MKRLVSLTLLSLVVVPCPTARAEEKRPDNRLTIKSAVLGEERVALVRTPPGYDTNGQRYPVLYMTDGDSHIGHTAATIEFLCRNGRMPEMIIVGITNTDRGRDLTPTKSVLPNTKDLQSGGGADKFVKFIETELIPEVEKTYRTQPYRVFAGHSLGGLLAVHILATKCDLFDAYIAVSPSLWWDKEVAIRELEECLKGHKELHRTLFLTLANEEGGMRSGFDKAKALLREQRPAGFVWDSQLMEDEDHGTVVLRSHYAALKKIFDGWKLDPKVAAGGMPALENHFKALSAKYKYTVVPPEQTVNILAYALLREGKGDEAIAAFKTNVERYPGSANVYDSLGEAYEESGKLDLARQNYERAVQLGEKNHDPNLQAYRKNLERAGATANGGSKAAGS
jgi:predicted alpha/beta superfamily hydrolase